MELTDPIKRGDDEVTGFDIRRPKAGELRGVKVLDLMHMDVAAVSEVLPRISVPPLSAAEVADLDIFSFGEAAGHISNFFTVEPEKKVNNSSSPTPPSTEQQTLPSSSDGDQVTSGNSNSKSSLNGGDAPAKS